MDDAARFLCNTTQQPDRSKIPYPATTRVVGSDSQSIIPFLKTRDKDKTTLDRLSAASQLTLSAEFDTDGMSDPSIPLGDACAKDLAHDYGPSTAVWAGGAGAPTDHDRKIPPLSPERKVEQKFYRERQARERIERNFSAKDNARKEIGRDKNDADSHIDRKDSLSSISVTESGSSVTRASSDPPIIDALIGHSFTKKHGRRYLRDSTLPYPLPYDLMELHRQTLWTMLLVQVFGGPVCNPNFQHRHPKSVLEVGCGTGYWSSLCHQYFLRRGHSVSFTGMDIAPLSPDFGNDEEIMWRFVQHDLRKTPFPFGDGEFDLIMAKDLSLATPSTQLQELMDEYLRILRPGGSLEIWDSDHTLRMLLPNAQPQTAVGNSDGENEEQERANATGTYILTAHTSLTAPQNQYVVDYNGWVSKALEKRKLTAIPCTHFQPMLLQEDEDLQDIDGRRLAIPLGEIRWEREGIGGTIAKDGSTGQSSFLHSLTDRSQGMERKTLNSGQIALRRTAMLTIVQKIEALEPVLREVSGKGQDEWDSWLSNMMNDLMKQNGVSWGECLEVGAWWATKKMPPRK